ncbi:hypothetical protein CYMTET_41398 [Cymbomonas tetramitiformis]|uniref:Uncharacterized protein n=1 Tax=Cymbomonas tetramitiformis TaxID=36881 RepID=A0AAE0C849_9CHLO|nr:hypothetical protein CYMTET_41398 [Cymbomonas tetramitiformis]
MKMQLTLVLPMAHLRNFNNLDQYVNKVTNLQDRYEVVKETLNTLKNQNHVPKKNYANSMSLLLSIMLGYNRPVALLHYAVKPQDHSNEKEHTAQNCMQKALASRRYSENVYATFPTRALPLSKDLIKLREEDFIRACLRWKWIQTRLFSIDTSNLHDFEQKKHVIKNFIELLMSEECTNFFEKSMDVYFDWWCEKKSRDKYTAVSISRDRRSLFLSDVARFSAITNIANWTTVNVNEAFLKQQVVEILYSDDVANKTKSHTLISYHDIYIEFIVLLCTQCVDVALHSDVYKGYKEDMKGEWHQHNHSMPRIKQLLLSRALKVRNELD